MLPAAMGALVYALFVGPCELTRGAASDEVIGPSLAMTWSRAITMDATPAQSWPWLVLDNLGRPSKVHRAETREIVKCLQR